MPTPRWPAPAQKLVRLAAAAAVFIGVAQAVIATVLVVVGTPFLMRLHEGLGYLYVASVVVATAAAWLWTRGRPVRTPWRLAAVIAAAAVLQFVLGTLGGARAVYPHVGALTLHMGLGLTLIAGSAVLFTMSSEPAPADEA